MYKQIKELLEKSGIELSEGLKESEKFMSLNFQKA